MLWLVIVLFSAVLYAINAILDNYIADVHFKKLDASAITAFGLITSVILMVGLAVVVNGEVFTPGLILWALVLSGAIEMVGYVLYYRAFAGEEATDVTVLQQFSPVFAFILGILFLGDVIVLKDFIGFLLIITAALAIGFGKKRQKGGVGWKSSAYVIGACAMFAVANILFKYGMAANNEAYLVGSFWLQMGIFSSIAVFLIVFKSWRKTLRAYFRRKWGWKMFLNLLNRGMAELANFMQRYAFLLAGVAVVSATKNVSMMILTFFLGLILTRISPKVGREKMTRRSILAHVVAIVLASGGVVLLSLQI